ncbi:nucleotidyltransferase domain-containing protein [Candidatus Roizmanbacteria bacterium]|nr:nucleotidyltransferase domain-containing protein [Candidatus Roizmanbacteria bacterium]
MLDKKDVQIIKNYFSTIAAVELVYLYGSQAKDTATKDSDVDLAVLVDEKKADSLDVQLKAMSDLGSKLKREVEVQNLNVCSITFIYRVISEGKIVFQSNKQKRVDYEVIVMRNYFDLQPFLREYSEQLARLARGGDIGARPFAH